MKAINPETKNSQWRKLCPDVVLDLTAFTTEPVKETMKENRHGTHKSGGWRVSRQGSCRNSRANRQYATGINRNASKADNEKDDIETAGPENKLTWDNLAEGCWLFKTAFDFFYEVDPSKIQALKRNQALKEGLITTEMVLEKWKSKKSQTKILSL